MPVEVNSEIDLRQQLLRVGDIELRTTALNALDRLEAARREVEGAAGDPIQLNRAMRNVELVFEEITNVPGNRNPGTTYGGRTVVYEDCQRDVSIQITPDLLSPIVPALSLLLKSLRWFMQSTALEFERLFGQTYRELVAQSSGAVRLQDWWNYTEPKLLNASSLSEIEKLFRRKWDDILSIGQQDSTVQFKSHDLKEKVEQLFPNSGRDITLYAISALILCWQRKMRRPFAEAICSMYWVKCMQERTLCAMWRWPSNIPIPRI